MSWPTAMIGDVCEIVSGATPKSGKPEYWDGDIAWATPKDLSDLGQKYLDDTPRKITRKGLDSCSAKMLPPRSVLLSSRAPIGLVAINTIPVCTNQGFKNLVPRNGAIDSDYLFWWLKCNNAHLQSLGRGATFKEVSKAIVAGIQIPLPPLAEQKRIAGILDAADALRAKRREALAQLDTLHQSTFLDMFGDPVTNPMGWEVRPLGELATNEDGKRVPVKKADREAMDGEYPYYGASGIIDYVNDYLFEGDRLLIGEDGANLVARATPIAFIAKGKYWVNNHAHVLAFNGQAELLFLEAFVNAIDLKPFLSGTAQPKLNQKKLNQIAIPTPPLELQRRFTAAVESVEQQKARMRAHLTELDALFASLQSRAFNGEL